jgi:hypothetical protein
LDILDTAALTRERFGRGAFSTQKTGRELLKLVIPVLSANLASEAAPAPPRGLEQVLRDLTPEQLAYIALRTLLNDVYLGSERAKERKPKNPLRALRQRLGQTLRDELEFAGLLSAKKWVLAKGRTKKGISPDQAARGKHIALAKFRRIDWTNKECAQAGDWLMAATDVMDFFEVDAGALRIAADLREAIDGLAEELVFKHPLYAPSLLEPPAWTSWRTEYDDRISATFVRTHYPETAEELEAAFVDGSIEQHALGVSAVQRVPLKINANMLPLLREFGGEEYKRDIAVAEALADKTFWTPIRCDFRGRFVHLCDFNYTRGDPIRGLFMFAEGKRIGDSIEWLEIAVANAYGIKGTWRTRHEWVAEKREFIKSVAADPRQVWLKDIKPKAKEPFGFAAACIEYIAAAPAVQIMRPTYRSGWTRHLTACSTWP